VPRRGPRCRGLLPVVSKEAAVFVLVRMKLYLIDGEDLIHRAGPFQTLLILADDDPTARDLVDREAKGFRIDRVEFVRDSIRN